MSTVTNIEQPQTLQIKKRYICKFIDWDKGSFGTPCSWSGTEVIFKSVDEGGIIKICPKCGNLIEGY